MGLATFAVAKYRQLRWESGASARANRCASNMRMIGQALQLYADDHGGHFPASLDVMKLENKQALDCPSDRTRVGIYRYTGAGLTTSSNRDTVLLYEERALHGNYVNVLFVDGRVESPREEKLGMLHKTPSSQPR
jgi:prepilin-type processing-associated H-X9-DG protein